MTQEHLKTLATLTQPKSVVIYIFQLAPKQILLKSEVKQTSETFQWFPDNTFQCTTPLHKPLKNFNNCKYLSSFLAITAYPSTLIHFMLAVPQ